MDNLRDRAGELIPNQNELLKKFKVSIFWVLWYKAWKNEGELIKYLNKYRTYQNQILKKEKAINNIDYKKEKVA